MNNMSFMTKKVLQINTVVNSGSTGRIIEETSQTAKSVGWDSYIAYGRNKRPSRSKIIRIGNNWDIKYFWSNPCRRFFHTYFLLF